MAGNSNGHSILPTACAALGGSGAAVGLYALVVRGSITVDLDVGRCIRALGPIALRIDAPRELVFEIIASPYLGRTPRAMADKLHVIERGSDMVLAAHYTQVRGFRVRTLETVRFTAPERVDFRLVQGPVPHVVESFLLHEVDGGTTLEYHGELGTDFWALGRAWGNRVARSWERAVTVSLDGIRNEAERRART